MLILISIQIREDKIGLPHKVIQLRFSKKRIQERTEQERKKQVVGKVILKTKH